MGHSGWVEFVTHVDPAGLWAVAEPMLKADPLRHSTLLTVLDSSVKRPVSREALMFEVRDSGRFVGAVYREPPWPMLISALPRAAVGGFVGFLVEQGIGFPAVMGPRDIADDFASRWTAASGSRIAKSEEMRLYALGELLHPRGVPGSPRETTSADEQLVLPFIEEFLRSEGGTHVAGVSEELVRSVWTEDRDFVLWEDGGEMVGLAASTAVVAGMSRVGFVYTPPEHRGRGYASAVVAVVSERARRRGAEQVMLYADVANPAANSVYRKIGYRSVGDVVEFTFA